MAAENWTRDELILAINLYCKLAFGQLHKNNPRVIELANIINRTPSAVAWKLANFASLDPSLKKRGIKGASHISKSDEEIWSEFFSNWEKLPYLSEELLAKYANTSVIESTGIYFEDLPPEGLERETLVRTRINQSFFRQMILSSYENRCCITGLAMSELLVAGHIIPWAADSSNRLNPRNGICLNSLHDKAFDKGLITFSDEFEILLSSKFEKQRNEESVRKFFLFYTGKKIRMPSRFLPDLKFVQYHRNNVFIK